MKKHLIIYLLFVCFSFTAAGQSYSVKAPMPTARYMAVSAAIGSKAYVIGGALANGSITNVVEEYDAAANTWTTKASYPFNLLQSFACSYNNKVYVVGGCTGSNSVSDVWEYNPITNAWTPKTPMPTSRCEISGALINGKIYITSGCLYSYTQLEIYDVATDTWTTGPNAPIGLLQINSGAAFKGSFYATGGKDYGNNTWYDNVMVYDPTSATWSMGPVLPQGRYAGSAVFYNSRLHYFGGGTSLFTTSYKTHYILPNSGPWQTGLAMPVGLYAPTSVAINVEETKNVYIFGGRDSSGVSNITLEYAEPVLDIADTKPVNGSFYAFYHRAGKEISIHTPGYTSGRAALYNLNGIPVQRMDIITGDCRIFVSDLPGGVYLLKATAGTATYTQKIIID